MVSCNSMRSADVLPVRGNRATRRRSLRRPMVHSTCGDTRIVRIGPGRRRSARSGPPGTKNHKRDPQARVRIGAAASAGDCPSFDPVLAETRAHTTGARSVPVHMHATWPGLNLESRDPPCRSRVAGAAGSLLGPLLVLAASGSQIESAPTATLQERSSPAPGCRDSSHASARPTAVENARRGWSRGVKSPRPQGVGSTTEIRPRFARRVRGACFRG